MDDGISPSEFHAADGTADWRVLGDGATAFFRTSSVAESARLVDRHRRPAGCRRARPGRRRADRPAVTVRLLTKGDDGYGMSRRDVELASAISAAARDLGLAADPTVVQSFLVRPRRARQPRAVMPFWRAALGFVPRPDSPDEDLVDPQDRLPGFWFEEMQEPRGDDGGAIHVAIWMPYEQAEARVAAALAAGGHLVRDRAPMWWTLADAAGNEIDISTVKGRD